MDGTNMGKIWSPKSLTGSQVDGVLANAVGKPMTWDELKYWQSGEWQVVQERLDDLDQAGDLYCPRREQLFAALDWTPFDKVKVALYGQDPYPDRSLACGIAFSCPNGSIGDGKALPPTLENIFKEINSDLHYPVPSRTDLSVWADRGVLLWNVIPSCRWQKSMSHDWPEWAPLTEEITRRLSDEGDKVFVFLGAVAKRFAKFVDDRHNTIIISSHPSPRGNNTSNTPFAGSRIFTRANDALVKTHAKAAIDWHL